MREPQWAQCGVAKYLPEERIKCSQVKERFVDVRRQRFWASFPLPVAPGIWCQGWCGRSLSRGSVAVAPAGDVIRAPGGGRGQRTSITVTRLPAQTGRHRTGFSYHVTVHLCVGLVKGFALGL